VPIVVVLVASRPAFPTLIVGSAIDKPSHIRVGTIDARVIGGTTPVDTVFVIQRAASVAIADQRLSRWGDGRLGRNRIWIFRALVAGSWAQIPDSGSGLVGCSLLAPLGTPLLGPSTLSESLFLSDRKLQVGIIHTCRSRG